MGGCLSTPAKAEHHTDLVKPGLEENACKKVDPVPEPEKLQPRSSAETQEEEARNAMGERDRGLPYKTNILGPPRPPCEEERVATLKALHLDDLTVEAPPDPEIENILTLVSSIFKAPHALVALFDDKRIFVRETVGGFKRGDFPWRWSFCAWTMASQNDQILIVPDATKDARFCENVNVTAEGGVRFYVGAPLIASNGHRMGTLCFADHVPREFDPSQASILGNFAEMVVRHVEKDIALQLKSRDNQALSKAYKNLKRTIDCFEHCVVLLDTSKPGWSVLYTNAAWEKATGYSREGVQGRTLQDIMESASGTLPGRHHEAQVVSGKPFAIEAVWVRPAWAAAARSVTSRCSKEEINSKGSNASSRGHRPKKLVLKLRPASSSVDDDAVSLAVPAWLMGHSMIDAISQKDNLNASALYFMTVEF